jgi:hypothetical protein
MNHRLLVLLVSVGILGAIARAVAPDIARYLKIREM